MSYIASIFLIYLIHNVICQNSVYGLYSQYSLYSSYSQYSIFKPIMAISNNVEECVS